MKVLYVTLSVVVADQFSKFLVRGVVIPILGIHVSGVPLYSSTEIIGNFLRFTHVENPGMAFGIDFGWNIFLSLFRIAASVAILFYLFKFREERRVVRFSLALILGGAVGNLIDRVFYGPLFDGLPFFHGRVVDFVEVGLFRVNIFGNSFSSLPVFNIADVAVTVGVVMLLFTYVKMPVPPNPEIAGPPNNQAEESRPAATGESPSEGSGYASEATRR